jgi:nucleoside-diphosphate-sugar epimerase
MRFSNDGVSWNPWQPYSPNVVNWDLGNAFGGSLTQGTRTVWAQVRDKAGNQPPTRTDTIVYDSTNARLQLGFSPRPADETIRDTVHSLLRPGAAKPA